MNRLLLCALCAIPLMADAEVQTSADAFTRYELLSPDTNSFRIYYDVSAATAGATRYYNPIRRGSEPEVHGVYDRMTGEALDWSLVDGTDAKEQQCLGHGVEDDQEDGGSDCSRSVHTGASDDQAQVGNR